MSKILIVGPNSYIAKIFIQGLEKDSFLTISVRDEKWRSFDYSLIETIVYFAAIVHHPEICDDALYDRVNATIPFEMAKTAVHQGVRKFIYISTVAVFGIGPKFGNINIIRRNTPVEPTSLYGKSKLKGENLLNSVKGITVQIIRLPNVYGERCPGTFYSRIKSLSKCKWLPSCGSDFKFSLISVENVAKAIRRLLQFDCNGLFIPQDTPILSIMERIKIMAEKNGMKQIHTNMPHILWLANRILPKKYTDNLYGGYFIDPEDFPVLTD